MESAESTTTRSPSAKESPGGRRGGGNARRELRAAPKPRAERPVQPGMEGGRYAPLTPAEVEKINGAALVDVGGAYYALAGFEQQLCFFDADRAECLAQSLAVKPKLAAVVGTSYYYGNTLGDNGEDALYWVEDVDGTPAFHDSPEFVVREDLFSNSVLDVAAVVEPEGVELVEDGAAGRTYLVGLDYARQVFVARLGVDGAPEAYALLDSSTDWRGGAEGDEASAYGAAWSYADQDDGEVHLLFGANAGDGVLELGLPFEVPDACWN